MTTLRRYAIFYAPPEGSTLARFGASWLGRDADSGAPVAQPDVPELPRPVEQITLQPRRYGFHGTLKPPFMLADGAGRQDLERAVADLAGRRRAFEVAPLMPAQIGAFIALVPSAPSPDLDALAFACVRDLDRFRAPADAAETERRRAAGLTPRQEEHLARWGYPYVLDQFRFHLTLTGPLDPAEAPAVFRAIAELTGPFCAAPLAIREVCLFGEDKSGHFHVLRRYELTG